MLDAMFQRIENAQTKFVQSLQEQFGYSQEDAEHILSVYRREHVVSLQAAMGTYRLCHGVFWEKDVLDRALTL